MSRLHDCGMQNARNTESNETFVLIFYTGYPCYQLYTYYQNRHPDEAWRKKLSGILKSDFCNEDMEYGTNNEPVAVNIFQKSVQGTVFRSGFLVNKYLPCLGYSPDGFMLHNDELHLIEVKCPKKGRDQSCDSMAEDLRYVLCEQTDDGKVLQLREKHQYYGQVQLGMFLTNTPVCHFLIYNKFEGKNVEILVPRNDNFQHKLIETLIHVYFERYLPYLENYY